MTWLDQPGPQVAAAVAALAPSEPVPQAAPEDAVTAVAAGECGEPLVELPAQLGRRHCYRELPLRTVPETMRLRSGVVERLLAAQSRLPEGFGLVVLDGWRTPAFQAELLAYYRQATGEALDGYVSDPDSATLMAPHTTGGAVDLTLAFHGTALALGTDFDSFDEAAHLRALEGRPCPAEQALARDLRRLLASVLVSADLAPYPLEWWHWSYGEQRWAAQYGHPRTRYSPRQEV